MPVWGEAWVRVLSFPSTYVMRFGETPGHRTPCGHALIVTI
jgi:hypothetical protein